MCRPERKAIWGVAGRCCLETVETWQEEEGPISNEDILNIEEGTSDVAAQSVPFEFRLFLERPLDKKRCQPLFSRVIFIALIKSALLVFLATQNALSVSKSTDLTAPRGVLINEQPNPWM
ncbi:hypothetical protein L1887_10591 [Cichorium endivia]|nr:hypothetical protein L1887_10591 [Cichorium endivia]